MTNRRKAFAGIVAVAVIAAVGTSQPAQAAVGVYQTSTSQASLAASSRAVAVPTGTVSGNTLITQIVVSQSTMTGTTAPSGWTLACSQVGSGVTEALWWRTAGSSEPASYTWTVPSGSGVVANMLRYSGLNTTNPVDACSGAASATAGLSMTAPGLTIHGGDALILDAFGFQNAGTTTPATGYTERTDAKTSKDPVNFLAVSSETSDQSGGACGTATCSIAAATATAAMLTGEPTPQWVAMQLSLIPSAPPAPTNIAVPTISGRTQAGSTLTATSGTWVGWPTITYAYQWQDCTSTCTNISGATSSTYTLVTGDLAHRLKVQVTATSTGGASASAVSGLTRYIATFFDDFSGTSGIITNEYAHSSPGSATHPSADWDMTAGCLYRDSNTGGTRTPDTNPGNSYDSCSPYNNNNKFRLNTKASSSGNTSVFVDLKQNTDIHDASCTNLCYYGTHIFMRYQTEFNLYYVSVNRADDNIIIKRKIPCGDDNFGYYKELTSYTPYPWTYNVTNKYKVTVADVSGSVVINLYDLNSGTPGTAILTATDSGGTNPDWAAFCDKDHDGILDDPAINKAVPAGAYPSASYPALTGSGMTGIRSDFANITFDNFSVVPM